MSDAKKVLIVDDDVVFADFLRAAVESVGHRAVVVTHGGQALAAFAEHRPHFVMLDILLPGSDGFQLCKQLRASPEGAKVPIVLMTGIYKKAAYERQGLNDCGADEYVHKPFGVQGLWRMLETHLGAVTGDAEPDRPTESADLSERPLVEILAEHVAASHNGVLFVRSRSVTYAIYLQWGEPVFVRSNDPAHRLHEVLQRSGQVSRAQIEEALLAVGESRGKLRLGQALVRRGALSEEQFQVALQLQLRLIFQHAFALREGSCSFIPGSHPTEEDVLVAMRPQALLLFGSKSAAAHPALTSSLPEPERILQRGVEFATRLTELSLKSHEKAIAQLVDGALTAGRFRAIADTSGCNGAALLHGFLTTGLLELGEAAPAHERRPQTTEWDERRFAQLPVAAAIADLHRVSATGTLEVRTSSGGPAKRVVFRRGAIAAAQSDIEEDRLGDMLVRLGLIGENELGQLMGTFGDAEPDDLALARALATSEHVTPLQVYWAAIYQAQAVVHGLFALRGALLSWSGGKEPPDTVALPDLPTGEVICAAARSLGGPALRALLPPKTAWLRTRDDVGGRMAELPLNDGERALLDRLKNPVQVDTLLQESPAQKEEVRRRLFALLSTSLACEAAPPSVTEEDAEEAFGGTGARTADFLGLLHEDGFESGRTGQHRATVETTPTADDSQLEETTTGATAAGAPRADDGFALASDFASVESEDLAAGDAAEEDAAELARQGVGRLDRQGDRQGDRHGLDGDSDGDSDGNGDGDGERTGRDRLVAQSRELLGRLAAARVALSGPEGSLEGHREALDELLARCEVLARGVLAETETEPAEGKRQREPAAAGARR